MPRNRTIYNSELIYAGPSPATGYHFNSAGGSAITGDSFTGVPTQSVVKELFRVQSFSHNSETPRRDVFQFGQLAALDRLVVDSPNVTVDMSYYASSFVNEKALGFTISSGWSENIESKRNFSIRAFFYHWSFIQKDRLFQHLSNLIGRLPILLKPNKRKQISFIKYTSLMFGSVSTI